MFLIHAAVTFGGSVREHLAQGEMRPVCSETACVQILHCANLLCDPIKTEDSKVRSLLKIIHLIFLGDHN